MKMSFDMHLSSVNMPNKESIISYLSECQDQTRLTLGVSLNHLVESKDLLFLKAEIVHNIFQWDVLKIMRQIKVMMACFRP